MLNSISDSRTPSTILCCTPALAAGITSSHKIAMPKITKYPTLGRGRAVLSAFA